jgi:hypothetical protein
VIYGYKFVPNLLRNADVVVVLNQIFSKFNSSRLALIQQAIIFDFPWSLWFVFLIEINAFNYFDTRIPSSLNLRACVIVILLVNSNHFFILYLNVVFPQLSNEYQASHQ